MIFHLKSPYKPVSDQPSAIYFLSDGIKKNIRYQTLLGATGTGKTFTIANVISNIDKPVLVISHNKTLAAQLYREFKDFFPSNAVEYFISYYDYYQPEAYIPQTDTYIEKDATINEEIDRLRLKATSSLITRRDVIVVASVSCIYNLGEPSEYEGAHLNISVGQTIPMEDILKEFVSLRYNRDDTGFKRGIFRVRGDVVEIFPSYEETPFRIEFFGNRIKKISLIKTDGAFVSNLEKLFLYPAKHFVVSQNRFQDALDSIREELKKRVKELLSAGKEMEANRLKTRTEFDIQMLEEAGVCNGIENYSRHFSRRPAGSRSYALLDYFPKDFLTIIDESHVTIPQIRGMYNADKSRKQTLVDFGFRLPSCMDNRPLKFEEWDMLTPQCIFMSATPGGYELTKSLDRIIEQIIRPTGLVDPKIEVRPIKGQIDDIIKECKNRIKKEQRVLITTLTKKMAEELSRYLEEMGIKARYIHSDLNAFERVGILKDLRLRNIDVLVGVNLLREGLDLPEVSLVAVFDADKEGFLRSKTSLIQVSGRAARNIDGSVILYADTITDSMKEASKESERRRVVQIRYNKQHNIKPKTIQKAVKNYLDTYEKNQISKVTDNIAYYKEKNIQKLEAEMKRTARELNFEKAALIRDRIKQLKKV